MQGKWLTVDRCYAAWPPEAKKMTALAFDKYLQSGEHEPEDHWCMYPVKIRAHSGMAILYPFFFALIYSFLI